MRKQNRNYKRNAPHRDSSFFVIVCEGAKTEIEYFEAFQHIEQQRIIIRTVPPDENKSAPKYVLERAVNESEKLNLNGYDQLWMVMDIDRWKIDDLHLIQKECVQKSNWNLALSNPCFEIWLLAHAKELEGLTALSGKDLKKQIGLLREEGIFPENPLHNLYLAISRALSVDTSSHFIPERGTTKVYLLVQELIKRIGEHHFQ